MDGDLMVIQRIAEDRRVPLPGRKELVNDQRKPHKQHSKNTIECTEILLFRY